MSDQKANILALQDIASQIMPTLLDGLSAKQKKEKQTNVKKKKKVKIEQSEQDFEDFAKKKTVDRNQFKERDTSRVSFADLIGQESVSEKRFKEQTEQKKPVRSFRKKK